MSNSGTSQDTEDEYTALSRENEVLKGKNAQLTISLRLLVATVRGEAESRRRLAAVAEWIAQELHPECAT